MGLLDALLGNNTQQTVSGTTAPVTTPVAPVAQRRGLVEALTGTNQFTPFIRSFAAGMATPGSTTDGIAALGQGLAGAQGYYSAEEEKARQAALEAEKTAYQRQQDALQNARSDKSLSLTEQNMATDNTRAAAAEKRAAIIFQQQQSEIEQEKAFLEKNGFTKAQAERYKKEANDAYIKTLNETFDEEKAAAAKQTVLDGYLKALPNISSQKDLSEKSMSGKEAVDEAGNIFDMTDPANPVFIRKQ